MAGWPRRLIALGAFALAVSMCASAAASRTVTIASHISIKSSGLTFSGRVTSPNAACDYGRHVTLYRTNGNVLARWTTGTSGRWKITAVGSAGITLGRFSHREGHARSEGARERFTSARPRYRATIPYHA